ncbi:MAG: hypothetical protein ACJAS3_000072 [Roseivirga sp.]|jgi:hypothetical protein
MRLRQLARKLEVNPNRLLEILHENGHTVENDPNVKLSDEHEELINNTIAPRKKSTPIVVDVVREYVVQEKVVREDVVLAEEIALTPSPEKKIVPKKIKLEEPKNEKVEAPNVYSLEKEMEEKTKDVELIKAPKLKLDGLKVIGMIELPKPKLVKAEKAPEELPEQKSKTTRVSATADRKREPVRKPRPSPLELERRRNEKESRLKREAEEKHLKELKEQHYKENVLAKQKAQAAKKKKKATKVIETPKVSSTPKVAIKKPQKRPAPIQKRSILGRIWAWLNGANDQY